MDQLKVYSDVKTKFELTHFKLITPFCYCHVQDNDVVIRSKDELKNLYENLYYLDLSTTIDKNGNEKTTKLKKSFINTWMGDVCIKTYDKLVFEPCKTVPKKHYNLWNSWKASRLPETKLEFSCSKMYQHMKYLFGDSFEYMCDKYAYIIQTGDKTDVADVLYSVPGCGKDTFYNYVGNNILGEEYYLNEDYLDIIIGGSFNDVISKKVLVVLNESKRAKTDDIIEAIKNAITREKNTIRAKGLKPRYETNYINWATLTNNWDAIKVEQGDRRFYADKVSSLNKGNNKYFTELYDETKSGAYDRACYDFFKTRKITVKSFQNERPITVYYKDLQERNIPIVAQFLVEIMQTEKNNFDEKALIFYNRYSAYLKENGFEFKSNSTKFGLEMKQYPCIQKKNTKTCTMYHINIQELREYLITNKLYEPVDGEECMFATKKDVEIKDDTDQLLQLQNEIKRIEIVKDDMAEQIKTLELQLQKYEEEKMHKKPKEDIAKKPKKKITTKKNDFVAISDTTFVNEITGKVFEIVEDNDMIDDEPF